MDSVSKPLDDYLTSHMLEGRSSCTPGLLKTLDLGVVNISNHSPLSWFSSEDPQLEFGMKWIGTCRGPLSLTM